MGTQPTQTLLSAERVAEELDLSALTIIRWFRSGFIPGHKISHKVVRFDLAEVSQALKEQAARRTAEGKR